VVSELAKKGPPIMSVFMLPQDFRALALSRKPPVREIAISDAWDRFALFDGTVTEFLDESEKERPHWFAAPGTDTTEHAALYSLSEQAAYLKANGEGATRALLAAEGLKLGQIKPVKVDAADSVKGSSNPYSPEFRGTEKEREARIASLINNREGTKLAASLARAQNKSITGQPLQPVGAARRR
jgi:hypothetical protein